MRIRKLAVGGDATRNARVQGSTRLASCGLATHKIEAGIAAREQVRCLPGACQKGGDARSARLRGDMAGH